MAALARARKAATLVRLRQDSEQNRRDALRETSTYTRSQPSARQTPSRPVAWLSTTTASPVAQPAPHSVPAGAGEVQVPGLAVVPGQLRRRPVVRQQRVDQLGDPVGGAVLGGQEDRPQPAGEPGQLGRLRGARPAGPGPRRTAPGRRCGSVSTGRPPCSPGVSALTSAAAMPDDPVGVAVEVHRRTLLARGPSLRRHYLSCFYQLLRWVSTSPPRPGAPAPAARTRRRLRPRRR